LGFWTLAPQASCDDEDIFGLFSSPRPYNEGDSEGPLSAGGVGPVLLVGEDICNNRVLGQMVNGVQAPCVEHEAPGGMVDADGLAELPEAVSSNIAADADAAAVGTQALLAIASEVGELPQAAACDAQDREGGGTTGEARGGVNASREGPEGAVEVGDGSVLEGVYRVRLVRQGDGIEVGPVQARREAALRAFLNHRIRQLQVLPPPSDNSPPPPPPGCP
jgi:hypothetical protein